MRGRLLLLLAVLLLPAAARAQEAQRAAAREAISAYGAGNYELAMKRLGEAAQGIELLEIPEQITVHKYTAYTLIAFDRNDEAKKEFRLALGLDPTLTLPDSVSPKIRAVFDEAKADMAADAERAKATPTPIANATPGPNPTPAAPRSAQTLGFRIGSLFPVGNSYHQAQSSYSGEILSLYEVHQTAVELAGGARGNSADPNVRFTEWFLDFGANQYLFHWDALDLDPMLGGGVGIQEVTSHWVHDDGTKDHETTSGLALWAGPGVTFFRKEDVHLSVFARYRFGFSGAAGTINHGPIVAVAFTYTRHPHPNRSCCGL